MTATTVTTWELSMAAAARAFRKGENETAISQLAYASWLAVSTGIRVPKEVADVVKRDVLEAAGINGGRGAA